MSEYVLWYFGNADSPHLREMICSVAEKVHIWNRLAKSVQSGIVGNKARGAEKSVFYYEKMRFLARALHERVYCLKYFEFHQIQGHIFAGPL